MTPPRPAGDGGGYCDGIGWCVKRDTFPTGEPSCNGAGRCVKGYASHPASPPAGAEGPRTRPSEPTVEAELAELAALRAENCELREKVARVEWDHARHCTACASGPEGCMTMQALGNHDRFRLRRALDG